MKWSKKHTWVCGGLLVLLFLIMAYMISFSKIQIKDLQSMTVVGAEDKAPIKITNQADLSAISQMFHQTLFNDTLSCPFGYGKIILRMKNKSIVLYPALDGCYIFKEKNSQRYIELKKEKYAKLMQILKKYGFEKSSFESESEI